MESLFFPELTDKETVHSYARVYNRYISGRKTILEIGIQRGGSLLAWACTGADTWGIDLEAPPQYLKDRVKALKANAYKNETVEFLKKNAPKFDMIVEDGSHTPADIVWAAKHYTDLLSPKGVMIIEDIPDDATVAELKKIPGFWFVEYDLRSVKGRWDDRIVVLEKI